MSAHSFIGAYTISMREWNARCSKVLPLWALCCVRRCSVFLTAWLWKVDLHYFALHIRFPSNKFPQSFELFLTYSFFWWKHNAQYWYLKVRLQWKFSKFSTKLLLGFAFEFIHKSCDMNMIIITNCLAGSCWIECHHSSSSMSLHCCAACFLLWRVICVRLHYIPIYFP